MCDCEDMENLNCRACKEDMSKEELCENIPLPECDSFMKSSKAANSNAISSLKNSEDCKTIFEWCGDDCFKPPNEDVCVKKINLPYARTDVSYQEYCDSYIDDLIESDPLYYEGAQSMLTLHGNGNGTNQFCTMISHMERLKTQPSHESQATHEAAANTIAPSRVSFHHNTSNEVSEQRHKQQEDFLDNIIEDNDDFVGDVTFEDSILSAQDVTGPNLNQTWTNTYRGCIGSDSKHRKEYVCLLNNKPFRSEAQALFECQRNSECSYVVRKPQDESKETFLYYLRRDTDKIKRDDCQECDTKYVPKS